MRPWTRSSCHCNVRWNHAFAKAAKTPTNWGTCQKPNFFGREDFPALNTQFRLCVHYLVSRHRTIVKLSINLGQVF
ncbi:hypothetical protein JG688_00007085 [Phytophthora aleatoria]|uniref:Uncharacterized protein n=1 Tax=Phytophthora aleatoria TaxID=2496075 RepID=A0A8J5J8F3_9STRA|nr:hypothetical protein JG688_00007085 [Phytophthora aleatoria]